MNTDRAERLADERRLHEERLAAYGAFAGALVDYRRGQYDRVHRRLEAPDGPEHHQARMESHRLHSAAQQQLFRVRLVTSAPAIIECADRALELAEAIHEADSRHHIGRYVERATKAIDDFISTASVGLQSARS